MQQMVTTVGGGYMTLHEACDREGRWDEFHGGSYHEGYLRELRSRDPQNAAIPDLEKLVKARAA